MLAVLIARFVFREGPAPLEQDVRVPASVPVGDLLGRGLDQLQGMSDGAELVLIQLRPQFWKARSLATHIDDWHVGQASADVEEQAA